MTINEMIEVLQAAKEGKKIESSIKGMNDWKITEVPLWSFSYFDYRTLQEPKEYWAALATTMHPSYLSTSRNAVELFIKYNGGTLIHLKEIPVA